MPIFRPENKSGTGFLGYKKLGIISITDKSGKFDLADVYLEVEMKVENSQYNRNFYVSGGHEMSENGDIIDSSLLKRIYHFFDAIGFEGGVNLKGEFEDKSGNVIKDIADYLNTNFTAPFPSEPNMNLVGYL